MCPTYESLMKLLRQTLLALQADRLNVNLENLLDECLQYLVDMKIIQIKQRNNDDSYSERTEKVYYETTKLGKATVEGKLINVVDCSLGILF
jgi:hypothetical protein